MPSFPQVCTYIFTCKINDSDCMPCDLVFVAIRPIQSVSIIIILYIFLGEKGTVICELDSDQEAELLGSSAGFLSKTLHVTQLALGHDAAEGDHTVYIVSEDRSFALGTLNKKTCPHMKLDIVLVDELVVMKHTGPSDVHVTGYEGFTYGDDDGDDDEDVYGTLCA